jgi:hypothetical protein
MPALPAHAFFTLSQTSANVAGSTVTNAESTFSDAENATLDYIQSCMLVYGGSSAQGYIEFDVSSSAYTSGWIRFVTRGVQGVFATTNGFFSFYGPTTELFRLRMTNASAHWAAEYWNGSAFVQIGSTITSPLASGAIKIDIRFIIANSGGEFTVYANGVNVASLTAADTLTTADTTLSKIRFTAQSTSSSLSNNIMVIWGGVVVDAADTRTILFDEATTLANGGETAWTNAEIDIDEVYGAATTVDFIVGDANNETETYTFGATAAGVAGNTVDGVYIVIHAKAQASPGLHVRGIARISATNYESDNSVQPTSASWNSYALRFDNNPSTAAEWANIAAVEAAEFGVRVKTSP